MVHSPRKLEPAAELKRLQREHQKFGTHLQELQNGCQELGHKLVEASQRQAELAEWAAALKILTPGVIITEHALLRFLERVKGLDMDAARRECLPEKAEQLVRQLCDGVIPVGASHKVRVREGVVVTVLTNDHSEEN